MLESLAIRSGDEPGTIYGLVAEEMLVAPDKSSITFRINPKAKFYNGDPVTADGRQGRVRDADRQGRRARRCA